MMIHVSKYFISGDLNQFPFPLKCCNKSQTKIISSSCCNICDTCGLQTLHSSMAVSVGILSIGDMGLGIARLLKAHAYRVLTVGAGRRQEIPLPEVITSFF